MKDYKTSLLVNYATAPALHDERTFDFLYLPEGKEKQKD